MFSRLLSSTFGRSSVVETDVSSSNGTPSASSTNSSSSVATPSINEQLIKQLYTQVDTLQKQVLSEQKKNQELTQTIQQLRFKMETDIKERVEHLVQDECKYMKELEKQVQQQEKANEYLRILLDDTLPKKSH